MFSFATRSKGRESNLVLNDFCAANRGLYFINFIKFSYSASNLKFLSSYSL